MRRIVTGFITWLIGILQGAGIGGDKIVAWIRTVSPAVAGWVIALVVTQFPTFSELLDKLSPEWRLIVYGLIASALTGIYYALARWAEGRWPSIGLWLLGSAKQPSYVQDNSGPARGITADTVIRRATPASVTNVMNVMNERSKSARGSAEQAAQDKLLEDLDI